ncbi:hypothetical protein [Methanobacterium alcaliphilum]|uniref:hypothetical protein n=1 Tax=Methanobacterium alcaliphilum TaxID=392018 RepID=UPI00200A078A|nr:hypothetical protein [Methanobacterium alcaliphilum]MCK9151824.1 hypothetical protein [Methanobacterium alcaliphilum]
MNRSQNEFIKPAPEKVENYLEKSADYEIFSEETGLLEILKRGEILSYIDQVANEHNTINGFKHPLLEALPMVYDIIDKEGYITQVSLGKKFQISSKSAWKILNFFDENGYIYHDYALKITLGIKDNSKVYVKIKDEKKTRLLDINGIWLKIKK